MARTWGRSALCVGIVIGLASTKAQLARAQQGVKDGQWPAYAGDPGSTRCSPLSQINKDNFSKLKVVWSWDTPDALIAKSEGGGTWRADYRVIGAALAAETPNLYKRGGGEPKISSLKATPLMVNGLM